MTPPDPFDSAAGQTHSYGDGCKPPHGGFWTDPEFLRRDKECKHRGCQGTGFLRNVPGPNETPCPACRPIAAAASAAGR